MENIDFDEDLPADDELAFCLLEKEFRDERETALAETDGGDAYLHYKAKYMNQVLAAAKELHLLEFNTWQIPPSSTRSYEYFNEFDQAVEHFIIRVRIGKARRKTKETVLLNTSEKEKIRHYIDLIKKQIDESKLDTDKKEKLFDILGTLTNEVDRDRMRVQAISDTAMIIAHTLRNFEEIGLRPYYKYLMAIFGIAGEAKEEEMRRLPQPKEKRRLEPPKIKPKEEYEMDDDIPF